jgi:hypothetical protein
MNPTLLTAILDGMLELAKYYEAHKNGQTLDPSVVLASLDTTARAIADHNAKYDAAAKQP